MYSILETHVSVDTADLDATSRYVEDKLGLEKLRQVTRPTFKVIWYPGLELWQAKEGAEPNSAKHVAWQVDDIEGAVEELRERGVRFDTEEILQVDRSVVDTGELIRYIFFTLPGGLPGELYEVSRPIDDDE